MDMQGFPEIVDLVPILVEHRTNIGPASQRLNKDCLQDKNQAQA